MESDILKRQKVIKHSVNSYATLQKATVISIHFFYNNNKLSFKFNYIVVGWNLTDYITCRLWPYNKGRGMCYPICGIVHIKEPLLLIEKTPCGSGFPLSLSEWSFTICPTPYNRNIKCVECVVK